MPSHTANAAPRIHPSMACGPPIALTISGIVMNGPTPTISIMLSAAALPNPMPRISPPSPAFPTARLTAGCMEWIELLRLVSRADDVYEQANGPGHPRGQLAEERLTGVEVRSFAVLRPQQSPFLRRFARIV